MSGAPDNKLGGGCDKPQQLQHQIAIQKAGTTTFPISLASGKLTHVKSTTIDTIKVAPIVQQQTTSIGQQQPSTTTFRISAAVQPTLNTGQQPHVRVVMPPGALMPQTMIKQIDGTTSGVRTQITAIPARTISQTSISVTRPVTPTTYIPRAGVTAIQTQRLAAPLRTPTPPTVTGLTTGSFVRSATVARNSSSPATTVISPNNATWMAATGTGQVQLIRAINQPRQRIITQNITAAGHVGSSATTSGVGVAQTNIGGNATQGGPGNAQQTFVATLATVLPPRQQTATLVYSNVSNSQAQQYTATGGSSTQRFTVAAALAGAANNPRQMRPIQLGNRTFSTAKLGVGGMNTTSISIRAPNIPILTPALNAANSGPGSLQARSNTTGNVNISTNSLTTTRIIQLQQQQQPGSGGQTGRLTSNLMLQPIIMNAAGGGKIGIRPSTAVATKVQPSLTITQLGLGKLTPTQQQQSTLSGLQGATISQQQQTSINTSSGVVVTPAIGPHVQQQQPQTINLNVSQNQQQPITHIVSVNQNLSGSAGQIITTQNVPTSANVPLAIQNSKGTTNVYTGTITPIKTTGTTISTPITKVLHQSQHQGITVSSAQQQITEIITSQSGGQHHQPTSVFIHARPPGNVTGQSVTGGSTATVIPVTSGTFLPAGGGTFYYESVPANSVTASTGVLSLTTTTVTSTVTHSQTNATASNLQAGIVTSIPYSQTPGGTFTVVPSSSVANVGNRSIGQIQIPISSSGSGVNVSQIQTGPIRFNPHHISTAGNSTSSSDQTITVTAQSANGNTIIHSTGQQQLLQNQTHQQISSQSSQQPPHHQIITMTQGAQSSGAQIVQSGQQQVGTTMLIPVQTSIKLAGMGSSSPSRSAAITNLGSVNTAFLRKRDSDGSPIRAAKNLAPTLLSMSSGNNNISSVGLPSVSSNPTIVTLSTSNVVSISNRIVSNVIAEQLASSNKERPISPHSRPGSSGGSTTVSANSSPGVDQQINEELTPINRIENDSHFNPINELYSYHQNQSTPAAIRRQQQENHHSQNSSATTNGTIEFPPRKKSRRSTNDSQNLSMSHQQNHAQQNNVNNVAGITGAINSNNNVQENSKVNNNVVNNKENAKPTDFIIKKPRTYNLLDSYKQNWKSANNHFQRHSDVKPREERRPTVMDLANQAYVAQRINGWKIHHLGAQMEDLCETEGQVYDKLGKMLKQFELHGKSSEIDRVSELIKGNMQRSKIISDGVNDARSQILKIFEHKSHVSDIIHRCASKRNFKKREKP